MWPQCLSPSSGSILLRGLGADVFSRFQPPPPPPPPPQHTHTHTHTQAVILDRQTEQFKQFLISLSLWCFLSSFGSIQLTVWEEMSFEEFNGGHLEYRNGTKSLCCSNASHQVSAQSELWLERRCRMKNFKMATLTYSKGDVLWRISKVAAMAAVLDIGMEQF